MSSFSVMTLISRLLGYVRDATIFIVFGAGAVTDAFLVAFRLPNLLRRLFAEGAFSQSFVPVLSEYKEQQPQAVQDLVNRSAGTLGLILLVVSVIGIIIAPLLILVFAPGFYADEAQVLLASDMLRITFPYILFISLTALAAGVLNVYQHYAIPALSPALLNLCMIAAAVWLAPQLDRPIVALAVGVLLGGVLQLLLQIGAMRKLGVGFRFVVAFSDPGVRRIMRLMMPGILGASVMQINLLIDTIIASFLIAGSISWLYISDRFVELPNGLFGVAIATVLLAHLSASYCAKRMQDFRAALDWAATMVALLAIPCTIGLVLLAEPILIGLIQYSEFSAHDTYMASMSLSAYAVGLPAFMLVKVLSAAFFSRQNMRLPVKVAVYALFVNLFLNLALVWLWTHMQWVGAHTGLAVATSLASWFNCLWLYRALRGEGYGMTILHGVLIKAGVSGLIMGGVLGWLLVVVEMESTFAGEMRIALLAGLILSGVVVYLGSLFLMGLRPQQIWGFKDQAGG